MRRGSTVLLSVLGALALLFGTAPASSPRSVPRRR